MPILTLFKSRQANMGYVFKDGSIAAFVAGRYATDVPEKIAELKEQITARNPFIFIDEAEKEIDTTMIEEIAAARRRAEEEVLAKYAKAVNPENKTGDTLPPEQHAKGLMTTNTDTTGVAAQSSAPKINPEALVAAANKAGSIKVPSSK